MSEQNPQEQKPTNESLDNNLNKAEDVILKNKKKITNILTVVVILLALFIFMKKQVWEPNEIEAKNRIFEAQSYFEKDSFALTVDFMQDIIDNYSNTDAGNGALLYQGIAQIKLGNFEDALKNLKSYDAEGLILPSIRYGLIADCYSEMGEWQSAVDYYKKASSKASSDVLSPEYLKKAGVLLEQHQDFTSAVKLYEEILNQYYYKDNTQFLQQRNEVVVLKNRAEARKKS